jgi:hypothetical protein
VFEFWPMIFVSWLMIFVSLTLQAIFCYWITSNLFSLIYGLGESFHILTCQQFNFLSAFSISGCTFSYEQCACFYFSFRRLEVE